MLSTRNPHFLFHSHLRSELTTNIKCSFLNHLSLPHSTSGHTVHRTTGAIIDEVIADALKDEMIEGINNNSGVLVSSVAYDSGNHSAHNSDGETDTKSPTQITSMGHHDEYDSSTLHSFTHLTNATDASQVLNRELIYSSTPLIAGNNVPMATTIIHQMPAYDNVLHSGAPGR